MSKFIRHIPCDNCGSRDNAALYSDGSTYCFGCGVARSGNLVERIRERTRPEPLVSENSIALPSDFTTSLPLDATRWLNKYGVSQSEKDTMQCGWSDRLNLLIFPFYKDGILIGYNGRRFGGEGSKYVVKGFKRGFSRVYGEGDVLVFTEDLLSAIRVSRVCAAVPLYGTSLDKDFVIHLPKKYNKYILWLDKDKRVEAMKQAKTMLQYGYPFSCIFTDKDPKEYNKEEIAIYLGD